jgi:transposase
LPATIFPPIPLDTVKAAQAVFGRSNFYLAIGDQVDSLFEELLLDGSSRHWWITDRLLAMLYLITTFQYIETLPDHLAADALHGRVDWKYALHLPLNYLSLEEGVFCKFRQWLRGNPAGQQDFQTLLLRLSERTAFNPHHVGLEGSRVITDVCLTSRLGRIWEDLNQALQVLAIRRPDWLLANSLPHWFKRYNHDYRNLNLLEDRPKQKALAQSIGADGYYLLEAISKTRDPNLSDLLEIIKLRQIWDDEFEYVDGKVFWNQEFCAGCSSSGKLPLLNESAGQEYRRWKLND